MWFDFLKPKRPGGTNPDPQARYDAAGMGRRLASWNAPSSGPNVAASGQPRVRDRARDSVRNDWAASASIQKLTTSLVGVGITPRWDNPKFGGVWADFVPFADADGVLDAYGMQTLGTRAWLTDGEVFARRRPRPLTSRYDIPVQVQLLESDYCPRFDTTTYPGLPAGNRIVQGIELDNRDQRIAYWFYKEHPGDRLIQTSPGAGDLIRVAARDVAHVFEPTRPGQLRGTSALSSILVRLRNSADFEDAVLDRQKLANLFTAFITRQIPQDWTKLQINPTTGLPNFYDDRGSPVVGLRPGLLQELAPGENITFASPPEAGATFSEYLRSTHLGTAAGQGLPYEFMTGDIANVSDRALRVIVNEFRRFAEQRQWQILIPMFCAPMARWVAVAANLAGRILPSEVEAFGRPEWSPHGWEYIHPVQDVQGKILARDAGLTSTSALIAKAGDDPRKILAQRQADERSGLTPRSAPAPAVAPPAPPARPTASARDDLDFMMKRAYRDTAEDIKTALAAIDASVRRGIAGARSEAKPLTGDDIAASISAAVTEAVRPLAEAILAAAKDAPPVEVNVALPVRETTSVITRNGDGEIRQVVQTERTIEP